MCPSAWSARDQQCDDTQASMPTRHDGSFWKNGRTWRRLSWRRRARKSRAVTAAIPDEPGHSLKQVTSLWKSASSLDPANYWASGVEQQEVVGNNIKIKGYSTEHFGNGDVAYFVWEGNAKVTPKRRVRYDWSRHMVLARWHWQAQRHRTGHLYLQV